MNLALFIIGLWFAIFLCSLISFAVLLSWVNPKNYKADNGDRFMVLFLSFLISTSLTFIAGGILG